MCLRHDGAMPGRRSRSRRAMPDQPILRQCIRQAAWRSPAAASVTAVPRSLASSISPAIAGALLMTSFSGLPLVVCGVLKIVYDLALLFSFRHIKPPEETGV